MPQNSYAADNYYLHRMWLALVGGNPDNPHAFEFDDESNALLTIDFVHHQVHEGRVFHGSYVVTSLADDANLHVQITTGTRDCHLAYGVTIGGDGYVYLFEAPNTSAGTALALYNRNRRSNFILQTTAVHSPTVNATGTQLSGLFIPGGTGPQAGGDSARSEVEWDLAASTKYLIRLTNDSGQAQPACIFLDIYEL